MKEPIWINPREALALHDLQLVNFGGPPGIRDLGLLESALARPRNVFAYEHSSSFGRLAAAYAFGIVSNHPFVDGNKRTGLVVAFAFLDLNNVDINANEEEEQVYQVFMDLAAGRMKEGELTGWFERNTAKR